MKSIGIIGGGNMGGAIFKALYKNFKEIGRMPSLLLCDLDKAKLNQIADEVGIKNHQGYFTTDARQVMEKSNIIIIAIKPQIFDEFCEKMQVTLRNMAFSNILFISIMAGVDMERLKKKLQSEKIIRSMPNLPAQVFEGLTGYFCSDAITKKEQELTEAILESFSKVIKLKEESQIDKITALSGSGPAYFFHLTKILQKQAQEMGFDSKQAETIAKQTFTGASDVFKNSDMQAADWEEAVKSPGGTTEAAINTMIKNDFDEIFKKGIKAAYKRAQEL